MKVHIDDLKAKAPNRPPGYLERCLRMGHFDGEWLHLSQEAYQELKAEYSPGSAKCPGCGS